MDNLINKEKYFEFINSHKKYTDYQKKYLMWYFDNTNINYTTRQSNKQIHNLVKFVYSTGDIDKIMKIEILFSRFNRYNLKYTISQIRSDVLKTDDDVINFILKTNKTNKNNKYDKYNKYKNKLNPPSKNDWEYMVDTITFKTKQFTKFEQYNKELI